MGPGRREGGGVGRTALGTTTSLAVGAARRVLSVGVLVWWGRTH